MQPLSSALPPLASGTKGYRAMPRGMIQETPREMPWVTPQPPEEDASCVHFGLLGVERPRRPYEAKARRV